MGFFFLEFPIWLPPLQLDTKYYNGYGLRQSSILGPILIYVNDLNKTIKFGTIHQFANDTNLILFEKSLQNINKRINHGLKLLKTWLRANSISLNASKTEIILFKPKSHANINKQLNFSIKGERAEKINKVKYLGVVFNELLEWRTHFTHLKKKLNQAIGLLSKIRHPASQHLLESLYF